MNFFRIGLVASFILGMTGAVVAQSPLQFLSSTVEAEQPISPACLAEGEVLQAVLARSPQPKGWVNIVACDDLVWQQALEAPGHRVNYQGNALLDFTTRTKVFNAAEYPARKGRAVENRLAVKDAPVRLAATHSSVPAM
ncbi:MAG: hypothetical protein ABR971_04685 [Acidobacteriaceae bacterium]